MSRSFDRRGWSRTLAFVGVALLVAMNGGIVSAQEAGTHPRSTARLRLGPVYHLADARAP